MKSIKELNNILKQLSTDKTELEKVELSIADNIGKQLNIVKAYKEKLQSEINAQIKFKSIIAKEMKAYGKEEKKADKLESQGYKERNLGYKLLEKIDKAAKDLGVNPTSIKGYKELQKASDNLDIATSYVSDVKVWRNFS